MRSLTAVLTAALVFLPATPAWAANQAPVAVNDAVDFRNVALPGQVKALDNDSDPDGDPLVYTAVGAATKGQAYIYTNGLLYYQPHQFATGTDSFTYTVSDGQGNTATGTVTVTLWADLPAPVGLTISRADAASATLTWPAAAGAVRYQIFRNTVLTATTSDLTWTDTSILPGPSRVYSYQIAAVNAGGFGGQQSSQVHHHSPRPVPTGLAVDITETPTSLSLTWSSGTWGGPWNLYRDGTLLTSTSAPAFTDTGLVTGRQYSYQVQHAGHSSPTSVTPPSALSAPVTGTPDFSAIGRLFRDLGGANGVLGAVTVPERAIPGGRQQDHRNGLILQQDGEAPLAVTGALATAYIDAGGAGDVLGFPVAEQESGLRDGGVGQLFEGGSIWTTGADETWVVYWVIQDGWAATGWEDGPLGYPIGGLAEGPNGYWQAFEGGDVYWSEATGSHGVSTPIYNLYAETGWEDGPLGYPTGDEIASDRGLRQAFEGGTIWWSPSVGGQVVSATLQAAWARSGWDGGPLGEPTAAEKAIRGGRFQTFTGGSVYWSPATGAQAVRGGVLAAWGRTGWENGPLGYPVTEEIGLRTGGVLQKFQGGSVYWSRATGAYTVRGGVLAAWGRTGWENGPLGYPVSEEIALRNGGVLQRFQGGSVYWTRATGAYTVRGGVLAAWGRTGWERGPLGYPVSEEIRLRTGGVLQKFQGGSVYWSRATGAYTVRGAILTAWGRAGWENGRLGYPVAEQTGTTRTRWQWFQGGRITVDVLTGRTTITYR